MELWIKRIIFVFFFAVSSGCALFTSHYDATRHENFTRLQAFHVKFIEDFTMGSDRQWNETLVKQVCNDGDLRFREAIFYVRSKDNVDKTGEKAVSILQEQFEDDCKFSLKRKKHFGKVWAKEHLEQVNNNYGYAVAGELTRVGAGQ